MSREPQTFKQRDLAAALRAAAAAGLRVVRIEVGKDGRIILVAGEPSACPGKVNEWDTVLHDKD